MLRAGNKPTGFTAGVVFLNLNGYSLAVQDDEVVGRDRNAQQQRTRIVRAAQNEQTKF